MKLWSRDGAAPDATMYLAVDLVFLAVLGAGEEVLRPVEGLLAFLLVLSQLGLVASLWFRRAGTDRNRLTLLVSAAAVLIGLAGLAGDPSAVRRTASLDWLLSAGFDGLVMTFLIRGIAWLAAFRLATLLVDSDLLLATSVNLALFLLIAVVGAEDRVLVCLPIVVLGSLYVRLRYRSRQLQREADLVVVGDRALWRHEALTLGGLGAGVAVMAAVLTFCLTDLLFPSSGLAQGGLNLANRLTGWFERCYGYASSDGGGLQPLEAGSRFSSSGRELVVLVEADGPEYWRGRVFGDYDGQRWYPSREGSLGLTRVGAGVYRVGNHTRAELTAATTKAVRFHVVQPSATILNVPGLVGLTARGVNVTADRVGRITCAPLYRRGSRYTCFRTTSPAAEPLPDNLRRRYLRLPEAVPPRVVAVAAEATAGSDSDLERMIRLAQYLGQRKRYTLRPERVPASAEVADHFLHRMDAGWCRHFATALAVMGRSVGVPCRLVSGYLPGELDPTSGCFRVTGNDAHVWVEAWLEGEGWSLFDATLLAAEQPRGMVRLAATLDRLDETVLTLFQRQPWLRGPSLLLALVGLATVGLRLRRHTGDRHHLRRPHRGRVDREVLRLMAAWQRLLRRRELVRQGCEPEEVFAARAAASWPEAAADLRGLATVIARGRYHPRGLAPEELAAGWRTLARLRARRREGRRTSTANAATPGSPPAGRRDHASRQPPAVD